jgi:Rrf2 family protein
MPLSHQDVLALEVVVDLADGRAVRAPDLAQRRGLKSRSLEQILQRLTREGILVGQRGGLGGGYRLARDAALISAGEVVRAARREPPKPKFRCSSAVKRLVKELEQRTFDSLREVTIASLASHR